jgi:hypothetical protein
MNREICVLIYSQYSSASEQLITYISNLPYDLAAITGMVLLQADSKEIRDGLSSINIDTVPCIYVKYFDDTFHIYKDAQVYDFITAVTQAFGGSDGSNETTVAKPDVMSTAMALQKQRENIEIVKKPEGMIPNPIIATHSSAIKKNVTRFDEQVLK